MSLDNWEQDIAALKAVLHDLESGRISLRQGKDEIVADITRRLRKLDDPRYRHRCG